MKKKENNYAFIDSQNVHLSVRVQGWDIDWSKFRVYLAEKYGVKKAYMFLGFVGGNNLLYVKLQDAGFTLIFKPVLTYKDGSVKGNVDAELVLHTMIHVENFDKAIIVTGDGDFYCLIDHLIKKQKLHTVLVPNQNKYSALLKRFAKKRIAFMNQLRKKIGR